MSSVAFSGHTVFCADVAASARFYEEVLGLSRGTGDDEHLELYAPVASGDASVRLLLHVADQPSPTELGTFEAADVDGLVARARSAGYAVTLEPTDAPWGAREAAIADADGNGVYLNGPLAT